MNGSYDHFLFAPSKRFTSTPGFVHADADTLPGFTSLYAVTQDTAEAIVAAGSAKSFKGVVWSQSLWIDIDDYQQADAVEERLKRMELSFYSYDSGGKGAHFEIHREARPSHLLPLQDKKWVEEHFPEADTTIYTHLHLFRNAGTIHEESGRPKLLVGVHEGRALTLPPYVFVKAEKPPVSIEGQSVFDCYRVMANSVPCNRGHHQQLVRLIYALRDEARVTFDEAYWWANEVNKMFAEPKSEEELLKALDSIYRG